jgi:hypothetical protein
LACLASRIASNIKFRISTNSWVGRVGGRGVELICKRKLKEGRGGERRGEEGRGGERRGEEGRGGEREEGGREGDHTKYGFYKYMAT